ncbi:MAG: DegT/DnrJ/EryC1/StrS family aminotransferase [Thermodesulfobacteriota bacterium]
MKTRMRIPFGTVTITKRSKELINAALESSRVSSGRYVRDFEKRFAALMGAKEAVAMSTGTDADALALAVLHDFGAERGDEVIVPALSFVATGNSVLQAGLTPVFADVDMATLNIDPARIEERITERTRAIMPVHLMGKPADMDPILEIAARRGLYVIEDAAEAHGATYRGRKVGSIGDMAAYSLYVAHIITTIEGGIVTTDRGDFAEVLRSLRSHGRACKCESCVLNISSGYCHKRFPGDDGVDIRFKFERVGFSSKMNELEAAVGLGNLDIFDSILGKKRRNLLSMMEKFQRFSPYLYSISEEPHEKIGPHGFPIILKRDAPFTRSALVNHMEKAGIDTRNLFLSMPTQCPGFSFLGYTLGEFPVSEYMGERGIHIGVHQDIGDAEIDYVMDTISEFLEANT